VSLPPSAAFLASAGAEALGAAAEAAIARARAEIDTVKAGALQGVALLGVVRRGDGCPGERRRSDQPGRGDQSGRGARDAADAAKQVIAKVRTGISLDRPVTYAADASSPPCSGIRRGRSTRPRTGWSAVSRTSPTSSNASLPPRTIGPPATTTACSSANAVTAPTR
jgi:hypothetical protein